MAAGTIRKRGCNKGTVHTREEGSIETPHADVMRNDNILVLEGGGVIGNLSSTYSFDTYKVGFTLPALAEMVTRVVWNGIAVCHAYVSEHMT